MRVAILAHGRFPHRSKTALGLLRYADYEFVAILDRDCAGGRLRDHMPTLPDVPIVESMAAVDDPVDALIIGIAPIGGGFDDSWRPDVRTALERGCDVISGLHYLLSDDEEFARLADRHGGELRDVRKPPEDLSVASGSRDELDTKVVLTVGTDCSVGKMTTTMEVLESLQEAGVDAAAVPTGQTGIMIEGWGIAVDRVISDFVAGAVERMILAVADDHDVLVVEGQGSIFHPAYSGVTCGLLHGAMADGLILCHQAGLEAHKSYEAFSLPTISTFVDVYESVATPVQETSVIGGALDTSSLKQEEARSALDDYADAIGGPATDPLRYGAEPLAEAIL